ncbi:MAG: hypothetical protein KGJ09_09695 [Candidatus Omnitrophica bacterium]|nr:hypothetical protein [Candidatus Omnitrophota bacterium]MDE2215381.1 hypothetical protein [Candidatus Omnitrophota bacterium]
MSCYRNPSIRNKYPRRGQWGTIDPFGTEPTGQRSKNPKLTAAAVLEIRRRAGSGELQIKLAREFKVSRSTICKAIKGSTWNKIAGEQTCRR